MPLYTYPDISRTQDVSGRIVASMPQGFGSGAAAYTTIRQAASVSLHYLPRACCDLRLVFNGVSRAASPPSEASFNAIEVAASVTVVTSKTDLTELSARMPVWFGQSRLGLVMPTARIESNIVGAYFPAGTWIKVITYSNRLQSTAQTVFGETGRLPATSSNWPQMLYLGGALNTNAVLGSEINTTDTFSTSLPAKVDSGNPTVTQSTAGYTPAAIIGRTLDSSNIRPVVIFGDSISMGSNDQARTDEEFSGRGYILAALGHTFPCYQASNSGLAVQYLVGNYRYNWRLRQPDAARCEVAYVSLGTNDGATGRTAQQIKDDLATFFDDLRKIGIKKIVAGTQICRNTTTDGLTSTGNQTEAGGAGFNAKMTSVNDWLLSSAQVEAIIENRTPMQTSLTSEKFALSTVFGTNTVAAGSTTTVVNVGTNLTASALVGKCVLIGTESRLVSSNTTTAFTAGTAYGSTPTTSAAITILNQVCDDGVHPTNVGHRAMQANVDLTKFYL